nr:hypothetical protein [Tanacetum cinerariifolium]
MADLPASPNRASASPDHAPALPDHLRGSPGPEPAFPDHVVDFPNNDLVVEIKEDPKEDQGMDIDEEDPDEDWGVDFEDDDGVEEWEDDEKWLIAPVTPPRAATPVRLNMPPLSFATSTPLLIDPIRYSTYEVGGPSSAILEAPHPVGRPLSVVASRDVLRHQELACLHVRLNGVESIQTKVRRSERAIVRDVRWVGERNEIIQCRTLSLVRRVNGLSDDRVADSIAISELQRRMYTMEERVQTLVDTLRVEVDVLHGSAMNLSQRVTTLEITLQEARAEIHDLRTCLSASKSSERCLITCVLMMDERISALEQRTLGPQGLIMPPRRLNQNVIERLSANRIAITIAEYEAYRVNAVGGARPTEARGVGPAGAGGAGPTRNV